MTVLKAVLREFIGMFVDDGALALLALGLIFIVAVLVEYMHLDGLLAGLVLLIGCILILSESIWRAARGARTKRH